MFLQDQFRNTVVLMIEFYALRGNKGNIARYVNIITL